MCVGYCFVTWCWALACCSSHSGRLTGVRTPRADSDHRAVGQRLGGLGAFGQWLLDGPSARSVEGRWGWGTCLAAVGQTRRMTEIGGPLGHGG